MLQDLPQQGSPDPTHVDALWWGILAVPPLSGTVLTEAGPDATPPETPW